MSKNESYNNKRKKIRVIRIFVSLVFPLIAGITIYSVFSGFYHESLFWLGIVLSLPQFFIITLLPLMLFTLIMEFLGRRLIQNSKHSMINRLTFLLAGTMYWIAYLMLSDHGSGVEWYFIVAVMGIIVSSLKLWFHIRERSLS